MYPLTDQFFYLPLHLTTSILSNPLSPCTLYQVNSFNSLYPSPLQFYQILYLHVPFTRSILITPLSLTTSIYPILYLHVPFTRLILLSPFTLYHFNSIKSFTSMYPLPDQFFYLPLLLTNSILSNPLPPCTLYRSILLPPITPDHFNSIKPFTPCTLYQINSFTSLYS